MRPYRDSANLPTKEACTLGHLAKRSYFTYTGDVSTGLTIYAGKSKVGVSARLLEQLLTAFRGKRVPGGFSMTDPTPGGLGEWVRDNSLAHNLSKLGPRNASHIAAILAKEGYLTSTLDGNAVILRFKP